MPGPRLGEWLNSLVDEGLGPEEVAAGWSKICGQTAVRDAAELERLGPPPRSFRYWAVAVGSAVVVGIVGYVAEAEALRETGPAWFLAVGAALASLVWPALRLKVPRLYRLAWLTGHPGSHARVRRCLRRHLGAPSSSLTGP